MGRVQRHYTLPAASVESVTDAKFSQCGKVATLYFDFYLNGQPVRSGIRFRGVIASRLRGERIASSENMKCFDRLTEYLDSDWISQIQHEIAERQHNALTQCRHFSIYLDSAGSFELLAEEFEILPVASGSWQETLGGGPSQ